MNDPSEPMRAAIAASDRARGRTSPNPWVGAVVVRGGAVVSMGSTSPYGGPHAEAAALANIDASGADLYTTLEPCMPFEGKHTPPCVDAIVSAGIRRVVVALEDPHAPVSGQGIAFLRSKGINVEVGDGADAVTRSLRPYLKFRETGRPYVIAKSAVSTDGMVGAPSAGVRWLTGPAALERTHRDRDWVDAILVGSGTVLADDPALTARPGGAASDRQPLRLILDGSGRTPPGARALGPGALVATGQSDSEWRSRIAATGASVVQVDDSDIGLNLDQLLRVLAQRNVMSLIAEGGPTVLASLFEGEHVDEVHAYIAPLVLGRAGIPLGRGVLTEGSWRDVVVERLGQDVLVRGYTGRWSPNAARR